MIDEDEDSSTPQEAAGGPLLTPEELDAIRDATRASMRGATMVVAERPAAQDQWRESLGALGVEFEVVTSHHQVLAVCRDRSIDQIVVDADACAAGGLTLLAAIRGRVGVPTRRIVVASRPTQTHLVACIGGGASEYLCRPLDELMLARIVGQA